MSNGIHRFSAVINPEIYLKDPESTPLGKAILRESVNMIVELGLENFTFRKLSYNIGTTEASIYRYFENKSKLLLYLTSWYWAWTEYQLVMVNANINQPRVKLRNAIAILANRLIAAPIESDKEKLFQIICTESSKSYFIKDVDKLNRLGLYYNYKRIVALISNIILEIDPAYKTPHMLVSTIIEGIHHQLFFAGHLPGLTDKSTDEDYLVIFYYKLAVSNLNQKNQPIC